MTRWWIVGVVLLLLAIMVQFPAAWLAPPISHATGGYWRVAETQGTVWRGRATLYSYDRITGHWSPGRAMRWRVSWSSIASGMLAARIDFDDGGKAQVSAGVRGWLLAELDATFPAGQLAVLLPSNVGDYGWGGVLAARAGAFGCAWTRPRCIGQIDLTWTDAATSQIAGPALGDYALRLTAEGEALRFTLSTARGRLHATGAGEVSGGRLRFTGEARAEGDDVRLVNLLRAIGRPGSAPGRYLIQFDEARRSG